LIFSTIAVIVLGQHAGDGLLEVEPFRKMSEDKQRAKSRISRTCGVSASRRRVLPCAAGRARLRIRHEHVVMSTAFSTTTGERRDGDALETWRDSAAVPERRPSRARSNRVPNEGRTGGDADEEPGGGRAAISATPCA
jgi:hypothetical protein